MSLDNIQLSPFLVQQLYKKTLYEIETIQKAPVIQKDATISFLGKNEKNILVVVNEADAAFLPDADLNLLVGILTACKLSLADIALVNFNRNTTADYAKLMKEFSPVTIFLFGIQAKELQFPLHFPYFQLQQYNDQTYISAPSLKSLSENKEQKKELWACLQKYISKN
jgi:DNA polymerase III psi subunit